MRFSRLGIICLLLLTAVAASANSFSFTGTFSADDQLELFQFTAPSSNVTLLTWGYAGGINANSQVIPAGGFDPVLSLFDATGGLLSTSLLIATNDDGAGAATDPSTGNAFDSFLNLTTLAAGKTYVLVLSQSDNLANGPDYGGGFSQQGNGNFTPGEFGCAGVSFCDATPAQRNGNWAVDITGVGTVVDLSTTTIVPEPGSMILLSAGIIFLALLRRRKKA
ncbi:MAG: PEP-CTERM sorting domain-containing protein [Acidobacteriia bacterium]|nr:PEP-CTERM sorting domain-containing protein [Terriglobia bacterium]